MKKIKINAAGLFPISVVFSRVFPLLTQWFKFKIEGASYLLDTRKNILNYYKQNPEEIKDTELKEALSYIRRKGLALFPYSWADKYNPLNVKVFFDEECGLRYVMHNNHRLYFKAGMDEFRVKLTYNALLQEQDDNSPHSYLNGTIDVEQGSILFDLGAAEGIFALSVIDRISEAYVFETEEAWIAPLKKTFEPWSDKVTIIHKYASDKDTEDTVTINTIMNSDEGGKVFLKLDVEGAEKIVLNGASNILQSEKFDVKAAVCTYHYPHDYAELTNLMSDVYGYKVTPSKGYMCCFFGQMEAPLYFRKGMIYCEKVSK